MKIYELTLVLTEEIGKDEVKQTKLVEDLLSGVGAKVKDKNILGVLNLAYEVKKQSRAWYGIFTIEMPKNKVDELEKSIKLKTEVLRNLLINKEEVANIKDKVRNNSSNI